MRYRVVLRILQSSVYVEHNGLVRHVFQTNSGAWALNRHDTPTAWDSLSQWFLEKSMQWLAENPEPIYIEV